MSTLNTYNWTGSLDGICNANASWMEVHKILHNCASSGGKHKYLRCLAHVECNRDCQLELQQFHSLLPTDPPCLFGNASFYVQPQIGDVLQELKQSPNMMLDGLGPLELDGSAMRTCGDCLARDQQCCYPHAPLHIAAPPLQALLQNIQT